MSFLNIKCPCKFYWNVLFYFIFGSPKLGASYSLIIQTLHVPYPDNAPLFIQYHSLLLLCAWVIVFIFLIAFLVITIYLRRGLRVHKKSQGYGLEGRDLGIAKKDNMRDS